MNSIEAMGNFSGPFPILPSAKVVSESLGNSTTSIQWFTSTPSAPTPDTPLTMVPFSAVFSLILPPGPHLMAVQMHRPTTTTQFTFDLELTGLPIDAANTLPHPIAATSIELA